MTTAVDYSWSRHLDQWSSKGRCECPGWTDKQSPNCRQHTRNVLSASSSCSSAASEAAEAMVHVGIPEMTTPSGAMEATPLSASCVANGPRTLDFRDEYRTPTVPSPVKPVDESSVDCRTKFVRNHVTHSSSQPSGRNVLPDSPEAAVYGPDQIVDADNLWTTERDKPVRLRQMSGHGPLSEPPESIVTAFLETAKRSRECPALATKVNGSWKTWTYQQYYTDVWSAAKGFIKLGLEPHNGVGIMGFNSPEWFISDLGAIFAGGLATGIYTTNSAEMCQFIANNARCNVIVAENDQYVNKIRSIWTQLPHLKAIVQYSGQPDNDGQDPTRRVYSWSEFMQLSGTVSDDDLNCRIRQLAINKCCTLIYTSGTTGNPKGVMLSHDNLLWTSKMALNSVDLIYGKEVLISYLPLSHVAAQVLDIYIPLVHASTVYFAQPDALKGSLAETLREVRPTVFLGVPRVWEKFHEKMAATGTGKGFIRRSVMSWARSIGMRGAIAATRGDTGSLPRGWSLAKLLVFNKVRERLGFDRCRMMMTAAAPISKDTVDFFISFNMPLMEIYGMSESSGPHTFIRPASYLPCSVGTPLPGCNVDLINVDQDGCGEVCMNGRNVFMGYLEEEEKTREAIDDNGLLHSGDIGKITDDGFLFITGRIKELLITAGGENVAPIPIEDNVKEALPCVSNCMLVGDRRKFLSILLTLKTEVDRETSEPLDQLTKSTIRWFQEKAGVTVETVGDILEACGDRKSRVTELFQSGIDRANQSAPSRAQTIQRWTILPRDFSVHTGELGPTLKMRRPIIAKMYEASIESIYTEVNEV